MRVRVSRPGGETTVVLPEGATVRDALREAEAVDAMQVTKNGIPLEELVVLQDGDELALSDRRADPDISVGQQLQALAARGILGLPASNARSSSEDTPRISVPGRSASELVSEDRNDRLF